MDKPTAVEREGQASLGRASLEAAIRERVRQVIEAILQEEVEEALGAGRSQRVPGRGGYRHGRKSRHLTLRAGMVQLAVPRARLVDPEGEERGGGRELLPRYRRSSPEVEQAVVGLYLSGGNTRRIRGAFRPLLSGAPLSKSAGSRLVSRLQEGYRALAAAGPGRGADRLSLFWFVCQRAVKMRRIQGWYALGEAQAVAA